MSIELKDDLPSITPAAAALAMKNYKEICAALLDENDYAMIGGKSFKKKSAWRKLARAFGISDSIIKEERYIGDDKGQPYTTWRIHVEAKTANGRSAVGIAACDSRERKFAHTEHDTYATAHTRAKNRAISDLIGVGEVSAEEQEIEQPKTVEEVFKGRLDGSKK